MIPSPGISDIANKDAFDGGSCVAEGFSYRMFVGAPGAHRRRDGGI